MHIIAGHLKGQQFDSPNGPKTHPMSDKIRGALFNVLGDIQGLTVLDAFAGSGAIGFEAISRGARSSMLIEVHPRAQKIIKVNQTKLQLMTVTRLMTTSASAWLKRVEDTFDIVILDPPFDDPQLSTLVQVAERAKPNGIVVVSLPKGAIFELPSSFRLLSTKTYGDATLSFYRKKV